MPQIQCYGGPLDGFCLDEPRDSLDVGLDYDKQECTTTCGKAFELLTFKPGPERCYGRARYKLSGGRLVYAGR